jgi:nucleoside phosphorylase
VTKDFTGFQANPSMGYRIHYGRILSGDQVVVDQNVKTKLTIVRGLCAEMEGVLSDRFVR